MCCAVSKAVSCVFFVEVMKSWRLEIGDWAKRPRVVKGVPASVVVEREREYGTKTGHHLYLKFSSYS